MGRATIVSETGSGQYVIKPIYNIKNLEARRAELIKSRLKLYDEINALKDKINVLSNERGAILSQLYTDIDTANLEAKGEALLKRSQDLINNTTKLLLDKDKTIIDTTQRLTESEFHLAENQVAFNQIDAAIGKYKNPLNASAWCADLTEGLTGEVGTIEIDDETNKPNNQEIIINAGGATNPAIGTVTPVASMLDYEAVYRIITLPMYQNLRPRYRAGKITAISAGANTCSVSFASEYHYSSIIGEHRERFELFKSYSISDVPAQYLTCNIDAFSVGDYVIVDFKGSWKTPTVIGFVSSPKSCGVHGFVFDYSGIRRFAKTSGKGIVSITSGVSYYSGDALLSFSQTASAWSDSVNVVQYAYNKVYVNGALIYDKNQVFGGLKQIRGACVKKSVLMVIIIDNNNSLGILSYEFISVKTGIVLSAGTIPANAVHTFIDNHIAINKSGAEGAASISYETTFNRALLKFKIDFTTKKVSLKSAVSEPSFVGTVVGSVSSGTLSAPYTVVLEYDGDILLYARVVLSNYYSDIGTSVTNFETVIDISGVTISNKQ